MKLNAQPVFLCCCFITYVREGSVASDIKKSIFNLNIDSLFQYKSHLFIHDKRGPQRSKYGNIHRLAVVII